MALFSATSSFTEAVKLINELDISKLPLLLTRIIQKLHLKEDSIFSADEEQQLCKLLSLSEADLDVVLGASAYIFEQAAYEQAKVETLEENLVAAGVDGARVSGLDLWGAVLQH